MAISVPIVSTWDATGVEKSIRDIQKAEGGWAKAGAGVKAAALPAAAALGALGVAGLGAVKAAEESAAANAALDKVLGQMGYAQNAAAAKKYADEISRATGIDDEAIIAAQTKLATFSEVAKNTELMGRATKVAADLAAAGYGDMGTQAQGLGKALQDPIGGMALLVKQGALTKDEQKALAAEFKRTGDKAKIQGDIMSILEKQVGGVAEATATDSAKMATAWGNLTEELGTQLLPMFKTMSSVVLSVTDVLAKHSKVVMIVAGVIAALSATILVINGVMKVWQAATVAYTAVQWALNAALAANPIGLVVLAIAALIAGLVLAYKKSDTFREIVNAAFRSVASVATAAFDVVSGAIQAVWGWLKRLWDMIQNVISSIRNIKVPSLPSWLPGVKSSPQAYGLTPTTRASSTTTSPTTTSPVVVTEEQIYRAVSRLLLRGEARNGRVVMA